MGWHEGVKMSLIALQIALVGIIINFVSLNLGNKLDDIVRQLEKINERGNDGRQEKSNPDIR